MRKLSLLIDADDTLWENNIFFENAFSEFVELLDHTRMTAEEIQAVLDEIEIQSIQTDGYGCRNFGREGLYLHPMKRWPSFIWSRTISLGRAM